MPVQKVSVSSDLDAKVPSHLQRTSITSLTMTSDPSHRCARVVHKGPAISCTQKDGIEMLRAEIREEDLLQRTAEHTSINIIFFGTLAKDFSQSARQGVGFYKTFKYSYEHPLSDSSSSCLHVAPSDLEGPTFIFLPSNLTVMLRLCCMLLRFYNLHALVQRAPDQVPDKPEHLSFHLHGGTSYGRGLCSLPAESPDLQSLKSVLEKHVDLDECDDVNDGTLLEIWYTPPEALVRTCEHNTQRLTLAQVKHTTPPLSCHVRAQLKKYKPQQLYQCLKLFCSNCKTMKDVPDDSAVAKVFRESVKDNQPCDEQWATTSSASSREPGRTISMHISRDMVGESTHMQLIFVEGTTLDEICVLSRDYKNLVPVRSVNGRMTLLDLTAPFLFSGDKRYYGCKQCSLNTFQNPVFTGVEIWDEQAVAEALGVQLMQFRLLIQFDLEDQTDTFEALLWENAVSVHVIAMPFAKYQDLQDQIQTIMDTIQPPYSSLEERPWLDLCLSVYPVKDNDRNKVCYQITNTEIREE
uniref:Protection of telomeres protein 1-like n=1 Tax=Sinocyclocheilus anshuiensis TaxID=1608454 RepID=A0A671NK97_9TELE